MAVLAGIVKSLLVIIIVASFMEALLPEGKIKPFVRFAIGLFIIIAILNPILNVLFENRDFEVDLWDYQISPEQEREVLERGNRINQQLTRTGESSFTEKMEGQVSAVAMLVPGVKEVETSVSLNDEGEIKKLVLVVRPEELAQPGKEDDEVNAFSEGRDFTQAKSQEQLEEKIRGVINNLYSFKDIEIEVQFEGG